MGEPKAVALTGGKKTETVAALVGSKKRSGEATRLTNASSSNASKMVVDKENKLSNANNQWQDGKNVAEPMQSRVRSKLFEYKPVISTGCHTLRTGKEQQEKDMLQNGQDEECRLFATITDEEQFTLSRPSHEVSGDSECEISGVLQDASASSNTFEDF